MSASVFVDSSLHQLDFFFYGDLYSYTPLLLCCTVVCSAVVIVKHCMWEIISILYRGVGRKFIGGFQKGESKKAGDLGGTVP